MTQYGNLIKATLWLWKNRSKEWVVIANRFVYTSKMTVDACKEHAQGLYGFADDEQHKFDLIHEANKILGNNP